MSNEQLSIINEKKAEGDLLYSLIQLEDFKAVLGVDDRDDKLAKFCLVTSTLTIENYCKRKLLRKKHFELIEYIGDLTLPLREYPVSEVLGLFQHGNNEIIEPDFYNVIPDCGIDYDIPFSIELSPAVTRLRCKTFKVIYWSGYVVNPPPCGFTTSEFASQTPPKALDTAASMPLIPADLSAACLELASWNMSRYKGRRVGMSGNIKGAGVQGEHFEMSIPENVRILLEPYKRRVI